MMFMRMLPKSMYLLVFCGYISKRTLKCVYLKQYNRGETERSNISIFVVLGHFEKDKTRKKGFKRLIT